MSADPRWEELGRDDAPALGDIRVYETDVSVGEGPVLLGLDAEGLRHLLAPVSETDTVREDRRSRGVHVVDRTLLDRGGSRRFCDVACLTPHLQELFSVLVGEMLAELKVNPSSPSDRCISVLNRWRELLERESSRLLSKNQLAGLFAELWFLRRVVELCGPSATACWAGPEGGIHDLRSPRAALEVKAITKRYGRVVEIHGQEQLRPPPNAALHLGTLRLESVGSGGSSVPDLVAELLKLGADRQDLLKRLDRIGYRIDDEEAYRAIRFENQEERLYAVDSDFPRIVPESFIEERVPTGVVRLVYQIDLTGEPPTPLDEGEAERALEEMGSA